MEGINFLAPEGSCSAAATTIHQFCVKDEWQFDIFMRPW